jgi:hypothetical protein
MTDASIPDLTLPGETHVAVAGDWHGNIGWCQRALPFLARVAPGTRTILHLGDFGIWPERSGKGFLAAVDYWARQAGVERILATPGNHESWTRILEAQADQPGEPAQVSERVYVFPRGYRFALGGTRFMSFGGAGSVDYEGRTEGRDWWAEEMPTDEEVELAIARGDTDVLLAHETVDGGTLLVNRVLLANPQGWGADALAYSALSRARVTRVFEAVKPKLFAHGHMHLKDDIALEDGRRIYSLAADGQDGNMALLDLTTLEWTWLGDPRAWKR